MAKLLASVSVIALGLGGAIWLGRRRSAASAAAPAVPDAAKVSQNFLMYFIVPLWAAAGVADWFCHRAADIEHTTGAKESLIHLLMLLEMAIPVLAGLFLEITSPVLALMIASFFVHEATALWDVSYAVTRREVTPVEQHVHSFLEMLPLMAVSFLIVLHWPEFLTLPRGIFRRLRRKRLHLPRGYVPANLTSLTLLEAVPYLEELWRCLSVNDWRLVPERRRVHGAFAANL